MRTIKIVKGMPGTGKTYYCETNSKFFLPENIGKNTGMYCPKLRWLYDAVEGQGLRIYNHEKKIEIIRTWIEMWQEEQEFYIDNYEYFGDRKLLRLLMAAKGATGDSQITVELVYLYTHPHNAWQAHREERYKEMGSFDEFLPWYAHTIKEHVKVVKTIRAFKKMTFVYRDKDDQYHEHDADEHLLETLKHASNPFSTGTPTGISEKLSD